MDSREDAGTLAHLLGSPDLPGTYAVVPNGLHGLMVRIQRARAYLMFGIVAVVTFSVAGFWVVSVGGARGWVAVLSAVSVLAFGFVGDRHLHASFVSRLAPGSVWIATGRPSRRLLEAAGIQVPIHSRRWAAVVEYDGGWYLSLGTFRDKPKLVFDNYELHPLQSVHLQISRSGHTLACTLTAGDRSFDFVLNRAAPHV